MLFWNVKQTKNIAGHWICPPYPVHDKKKHEKTMKIVPVNQSYARLIYYMIYVLFKMWNEIIIGSDAELG